jgi:hypothetical protein
MTSQHDDKKIKKSPQKDLLLKETLKNQDPTQLPKDEKFYENFHNEIMLAIETVEAKKTNKWSQPFVFLEPGEVHNDIEKNKLVASQTIKLPS